ncbi:hypothetical protein HMPREF0063_11232 [Aeromicrobium marinum DSM 15272]|uniref:Uncharacterized protein n=1 Tax=Aeromicrobium marinum DSM 15272 TaxID=585531 RepID=E2SB23_9ACTN|nr:hypothetical protein HMPREF0063_11232 [Aeromicrobium marinum DSM 15272]
MLGIVAGIGAVVATIVTDLHPVDGPDTYTAAVVDDVSSVTAQVSIIAGYVTVALLLVLAAAWRRHVEPRALTSTAARVVPLGLTAAAGALSLGYGWKGALGLYNGGSEDGSFDRDGLYVLFVLNDFGSFIGYLGVSVAAGAVAWMALRERLISRWIGVVSIIVLLPVVVTVVAFGLPGFPGVVSGLWLLITFTGLTFGRSTIVR